jgi:UDP-N-acetylmuramate--alanine ligase
MKIYCSGIGGIGLSAYASLAKKAGHDVSGSDRARSEITDALEVSGMAVHLEQVRSNITDDIELLVYSEAVPEHSPERLEAKRLGIRSISYFAAVGELINGKTLIAICGTHGKSSTTAMIAKILIHGGMNPSVILGTKAGFLEGGNWRSGNNDLWVVEACEYRRSFLYLHPTTIVITTMDGDHFDSFKNQKDYSLAFEKFIALLPKDGTLIADSSEEEVHGMLSRTRVSVTDVGQDPLPQTGAAGLHMRRNARLAAAVGRKFGIDTKTIASALTSYQGSWRRMEERGITTEGVTIVDDYGHHPREIKATLQAIRERYPMRRIVCTFQPHTHDRTLKMWDELTASFGDADSVVISDIYDARPDRDEEDADIHRFAKETKGRGGSNAVYGGNLQQTEQLLRGKILKKNDVLVVMGAGDCTKISDALLVP